MVLHLCCFIPLLPPPISISSKQKSSPFLGCSFQSRNIEKRRSVMLCLTHAWKSFDSKSWFSPWVPGIRIQFQAYQAWNHCTPSTKPYYCTGPERLWVTVCLRSKRGQKNTALDPSAQCCFLCIVNWDRLSKAWVLFFKALMVEIWGWWEKIFFLQNWCLIYVICFTFTLSRTQL